MQKQLELLIVMNLQEYIIYFLLRINILLILAENSYHLYFNFYLKYNILEIL